MRFKIFYKFLIAITVFSLFPLIWLGTQLLKKSEEGIKTPVKELHLNVIENMSRHLIAETEKYTKLSQSIVHFMLLIGDWASREIYINSIVDSWDEIISISIADKTGNEVIKVSKQAKTLGKIPKNMVDYVAKNYIGLFFDNNSIKFLYSPQNYIISFEIDKNSFVKNIFSNKIGNGSVFVFNDKKSILYANTSNTADLDIIKKLLDKKEFLALMDIGSPGVFETDIENLRFLGAISCEKRLDLCFASVQEARDVYLYVDLARRQAIFIIVLAAFFSIIVSYFLSRMLSKPILEFINAAKRVAEKDFSVRVNINTSDELEDLRDTFNKMVEEIEKYSNLQIERILRERSNLNAVMYSTEDGIIMVDSYWKIQLINRIALSIIDAKTSDEQSIIGNNIIESINNERVKEAIIELKNKQKDKVDIYVESKNYKKYYRVMITDIRMKKDYDISGYLFTFHDITYDKEIEKIKETFLHTITHDLRNPVSAIKGFSEFLLKEIAGPINQNQRNMILSIDRAAFRLLGMINNILDIAKMESGKMEISLSKFNVTDTIYKCVDLMKILGEKKNIKFTVNAPNEIIITADQLLIERVYTNLIGNAIKFTPQDGIITIVALTEGDMFKSWVEDTGEGIPLEYIDKVFEKFEQVKGQKGGGTGLGLTICKYIVEAHLGRIWAEWRANMGAKIVFTFPLNLSKDEFGRVIKS